MELQDIEVNLMLIGSLVTNFKDILIKTVVSIQGSGFVNVIWNMTAIFPRPQCVKPMIGSGESAITFRRQCEWNVMHRQSACRKKYPSSCKALVLYSLSGRTSYRQISWSLGDAKLDVIIVVYLWNLIGISTALLPRCLSNVRAIEKV